MDIKAILKAGLITGLVQGVCINLLVYSLLYQRLYDFEMSELLSSLINLVTIPLFLMAFISMGIYAVWLAGEQVDTAWRGLATGATSGMVAAVVIFLLVGATSSVLVLGVIPFITYLAQPEQLAGLDIEELLKPVVKNAIAGVYLMILAHLAYGAVVGGIEGWAFTLWRLRRRPVQARPDYNALG